MKKSDTPYLQHILAAIEQLEVYNENLTYEAFAQNRLLQDGFIRQLAIIGEASNQLSGDFRNSFAQIPWTDIITMRNKLIHEYFGVDLKAVWMAVQEDLPVLKSIVIKTIDKK